MKIHRGCKPEVDLNNMQKTACARHAGAARYAYNWGLARKQVAYHAGEKVPSAIDLHRALNPLKPTELAWMYEVSKCAPQEALRNLDTAFANFFRRGQLKKEGKWQGKVGFPRFKSKKSGLGSFRLTGAIHIFASEIQLPRLGRWRLQERDYLPTSGAKILSATVSEHAGRWFVSVQVEMDVPDPVPADQPAAGVDLGVKALATVSDGTVIPNPNALKRDLRKVKRRQRAVSRKLKNHKLARAIADVGLSEFRRQLAYKAQWYGSRVVVAHRFFPSSKMCSQCHHVKEELSLSERVFRCEVCGFTCDRDLNAALNLAWYTLSAVEGLAASSADNENACGESVRPDASPAVLDEAGTEHHLGLS